MTLKLAMIYNSEPTEIVGISVGSNQFITFPGGNVMANRQVPKIVDICKPYVSDNRWSYPLVIALMVIITVFCCHFAGCVPATKGFEPVTVSVCAEVKVVDDAKLTDSPGKIGTYRVDNKRIAIVGKQVNGKIVLPEVVLGHEMMHVLQMQDREHRFVDPDK